MIRVRTQIDVRAVSRKLSPVTPELVGTLREELGPAETELRRRTPVDTGRLRASSTAHLRGTAIRVGWLFVPYARYVENPNIAPHGNIVRDFADWLEDKVRRKLGTDFVRRLRRRG